MKEASEEQWFYSKQILKQGSERETGHA